MEYAVPDALGFHFEDIKTCGGPQVKCGSNVSILYRMALSADALDAGQLIETTYSPDIPVAVHVSEDTLMPGVYEGLLDMRGGGSIRRVVIPPSMAFGERGYNAVPPNATLYVELCVVTVYS